MLQTIIQCKKDILYLMSDVDNWEEKIYLTTALLSALKDPYGYSEEVSIMALKELKFKGV
jgi:hypothetical protein